MMQLSGNCCYLQIGYQYILKYQLVKKTIIVDSRRHGVTVSRPAGSFQLPHDGDPLI